ncbi:MAG: hypothetical protein GEU71_14285 [Actinobacteria bacterium]|nr:hypothetical protein [Actinomycetota bacterium]
MEPIGIWLLSIGLGDMIAGYSGEVATKTRGWWAWGIGSAATLSVALLGGLCWSAALGLMAWSCLTLGLWLWARLPETWSASRAAAILGGVAGAAVVFALSGGWWPEAGNGAIERLIDELPYPVLSGQSQGRVLTILGALLFLQATANALVRSLLAVVGTPEADQSLRGGRFIGPMERTLIFGLGVSGYLTAAAVVATAKGLLRFPEISKEDKTNIHAATEYFLVGSLASWILALAPLALL